MYQFFSQSRDLIPIENEKLGLSLRSYITDGWAKVDSPWINIVRKNRILTQIQNLLLDCALCERWVDLFYIACPANEFCGPPIQTIKVPFKGRLFCRGQNIGEN